MAVCTIVKQSGCDGFYMLFKDQVGWINNCCMESIGSSYWLSA